MISVIKTTTTLQLLKKSVSRYRSAPNGEPYLHQINSKAANPPTPPTLFHLLLPSRPVPVSNLPAGDC